MTGKKPATTKSAKSAPPAGRRKAATGKSGDLTALSLFEAAAHIEAGTITSEALVSALIERIAAREPVVKAWSAFDPALAVAQAKACAKGPRRGALHGVPVGIKDVLETYDYPTQMGSPIFDGYRTRGDAAAVAMLRGAGAIVLGKTVTCEFAGIAPGATTNPLDPTRTPGGSSSGSAAAVADHMVAAALGTQTGGSILRPASFCGVVGYKPTYNTVNRQGLKFAAEGLDTIGAITRDVVDAGLITDVMRGRMPHPARPLERAPRIGLCRTYLWDSKASPETQAAFQAAAKAAVKAGAHIIEFNLPDDFDRLTDTREVINNVERARAMAWEWQHHRDALSPQLVRTIEMGIDVSAERYLDAVAFAERCRLRIDIELQPFDVLLVPAVNGEAPVGIGYAGDPAFQGLWTLLHTPSICVPFASGPNGMPVGVQFVAARRQDDRLLATARWFEDHCAGSAARATELKR